MRDNKLLRGFRKFKETLKGMTAKQKLEYLWEYYRGVLWTVIALIFCGVVVATCVININTDIIIAGVTVNLDISMKGQEYIAEDFYDLKHKTGKREAVNLSSVYFNSFNTTADIEYSYNASMSVIAQISAQTLDFIFMNELGMEYYVGQELFMDIRDFLTEEELVQWKDKLIYAQSEDSDEMYPVALNITETAFASKNLATSDVVYLSFAVNTPRKDTCREFFDYIMKYE